MLTDMKSILLDAKKNKYGVAAADVWSESSIKAVIAAAENENAPAIIAIYPAIADVLEVGKIAADLASKSKVPLAVHLDHGTTFDQAVQSVKAGLTSVMVDRSTLPFEDNVREVKEIVKLAHAVGVTVEAELGHVGQGFEYEQTKNTALTDPKQAVEFVKQTGVDCLAVAVGTSHGVYKGKPEIHFDLLETLRDALDVPLVLHGCSGTGDENLKKAIEFGITKLNLYTDLDMAGLEMFKNYSKGHDNYKIVDASKIIYKGYTEKLQYYIRLFGSNNRA
ncbi:MAG: ketose-bisphosphate aldolase [Clostridiaceae bacterium]|jgi:fructose-bisphosphate aldolase class II|nr:ketose-bisphosphate aldolase [Clostridiaceae bacterium]